MRNTSLKVGEPHSPHKSPFQLTSTEAELQSTHKRLEMEAEAVYCGKLSKIAKPVDLVLVRVRVRRCADSALHPFHNAIPSDPPRGLCGKHSAG
jgi:hypothetical protein